MEKHHEKINPRNNFFEMAVCENKLTQKLIHLI